MKKMITAIGSALVIVSMFFSISQKASAQTCMETCLQSGKTAGECAGICGSYRPPEFDDPNDAINPVQAPTNETFDALNPFQIAGGDSIDDNAASEFADQLSSPGGIVTRVLVFIFPLAGLILFLMISWGGFEILTGAGDSGKVTAGKQRITAAIVGFLILFASYWMVQIMEVVFGVVIF